MPDRRPEDTRSRASRLYDEHGTALYRYALMLLADAAAAEDVVQQVFASLLGVRSIDKEVHYLRRAVRNECYSLLRTRVRRGEISSTGTMLEPVAEDRQEERLMLERALRALPPEQREVVHLHVYEGRTFQEIADTTDDSINTVASRYRYALAKLRELLE